MNKNMLHSMAHSAGDTSDDNFAPAPLLAAVPLHQRPPNYWARLPEAVVEEVAVDAPAPPAPSFAHDLASAKQHLLANMAAQGHKGPCIRYDLG